jgi:hypothetical protein
MTWAALRIALTGVYAYRFEASEIVGRITGELFPSEPQVGRGGEVIVNRRLSREFAIGARVNGARATFLFDTGASAVVPTAADARRAGIPAAGLSFDVPVSTTSDHSLSILALMARNLARRPSTNLRKRASQRRSRATVSAIVEATARILVREGFDKASTNRIAEVAGVSVGSLYQYFPSKEALVVAVIDRHNREIMQVVCGELAEAMSLPVEKAVRKMVTVAVKAHRVNPKLHRVLVEQIPRVGKLADVETFNQEN